MTRIACILLFVTCVANPAWADPAESAAFMLRFDSQITSTSDSALLTTHVAASFLLDPIEGELGHYSGVGRLLYTELSGMPGDSFPTDGVLNIFDLQISPEDGTVVIQLFPGYPQPFEWSNFPGFPPVGFNQWFGVFLAFHMDEEFGPEAFRIDTWEYPTGDILARKTYARNMTVEAAFHQENTIIELTPIVELPRIEKINIESTGSSVDDPETGKKVNLSANLSVPFPFAVERCTWTGNNFAGEGMGDIKNSCKWSYTPQKGEGPKRETYGDKDLTLMVIYRFGAEKSALEQSKSRDYKVFFAKKGDDDSNDQPNWFDYWGDDGAVPGLDDSNVEYDATQDSTAYARSGKVFMGPVAADTYNIITIQQLDSDCPGGSFPESKGINLTAITLAHEKKHVENDALANSSNDFDGDDVADIIEALNGTSSDNTDSCNLADGYDLSSKSFGDSEFASMLAELGVTGEASNDWALPGRQATKKTPAEQSSSQLSGAVAFQPQFAKDVQLATGVDGPQGVTDNTLTGVYSAVGQDSDADSLFNALLFEAEVDVVMADQYSVVAWLADDLGVEVAWARTNAELAVGTSMVQLVFDGAALNQTGVSQPFVVSRVELNQLAGKHNLLQNSATDVLITSYDSSDFDPPAATLVGAVSEQPIDESTDGLYDRLDITVDLTVNDPGEYEVSAQLMGSLMSLLDSQTVLVAEGATNEQVVLSFDGASIFFHRENGPFQLTQLRLSDVAEDVELDYQANAWTTAAYPFTDFQQTEIFIDETSYTDAGGEPDLRGKFTTLDVMFDIRSTAPGPFVLQARLEDSKGKLIARVDQQIGLGGVKGAPEIAMAVLSFDGKEISASGLDGPYQLADVTVISDEGIVMDQNPTPYLTAAYAADDFSTTLMNEIFVDGFE